MNHWLKLSIPLFLGIVAAIINAGTIASKTAPQSFVRVTADMEPGQKLTSKVIERFVLNGVSETANGTLVPWKDKAAVVNFRATRALHAGDPVFYRDVIPVRQPQARLGETLITISLSRLNAVPDFIVVGTDIDFLVGAWDEQSHFSPAPTPADASSESVTPTEPTPAGPPQKDGAKPPEVETIGPFRVAAVGPRITPLDEVGDGSKGNERVLTIAARFESERPVDEDTSRLLAALHGRSTEQILGVALSPNRVSATATSATATPAAPAARARSAVVGQASRR